MLLRPWLFGPGSRYECATLTDPAFLLFDTILSQRRYALSSSWARNVNPAIELLEPDRPDRLTACGTRGLIVLRERPENLCGNLNQTYFDTYSPTPLSIEFFVARF